MIKARLFPGESRPYYEHFKSCDSFRASWTENEGLNLFKFLIVYAKDLSSASEEIVKQAWDAILKEMHEETNKRYDKTNLQCVIDATLRTVYHTIKGFRELQHPDFWLLKKVSFRPFFNFNLPIFQTEIMLVHACSIGLGWENVQEKSREYMEGIYKPGRFTKDKLLGEPLKAFFNDALEWIIPEFELKVTGIFI